MADPLVESSITRANIIVIDIAHNFLVMSR